METITFALLAIIVTNILWFLKRWYDFVKKFDQIPGPKPRWPLIGNMDHLVFKKGSFTKRINELLEEMYQKYKKEGKFLLLFGSKPALYIFKPEYVNEVVKDNTLFNKSSDYSLFKAWLGNGLITANGQTWKAKRKMLNPTFNIEILNEFIPIINEQISIMMKIIASAKNKEYIDVHKLFCNLTMDVITSTSMGTPFGIQLHGNNQYMVCASRTMNNLFNRIFNPLLWSDFIYYRTEAGKQVKEDITFMHNFAMNIIKNRKEKLNSGEKEKETKKRKMAFLDLLIALQSSDPSITDESILEDVETFIFAGNETTSTVLTWAFLMIGRNEEVQKKMREELDSIFGYEKDREITRQDLSEMNYIECVIKEAMRKYPPGPLNARLAPRDLEMFGCKIPEGTTIWINLLKLHQNEDVFPNPSQFKPERFLDFNANKISSSFIPFSAGLRNCIGKHFAMNEMKLVLAHVFRKYSIVALDSEDTVEKVFDGTFRSRNEIRIKFSPL